MSSAISFHIRQFSRARFDALYNDRCALVRVRSGLKRISTSLGAVQIDTGMLGVIAPRLSMTVENCPTEAMPYAAQLLIIPEMLVETARSETGIEGTPMRATARGRVLAAFDRAVAYTGDAAVPERLKSHAVREVLLWLGEEGIGFGRPLPPTLADRLRAMISTDPARDWHASDAARNLAISEPTLRRHLAAEGTGFSAMVIDIRMIAALAMLQATDLPMNRIALDVGYACPSRFAVRFRKRFGLAPSHIRKSARMAEPTLVQ